MSLGISHGISFSKSFPSEIEDASAYCGHTCGTGYSSSENTKGQVKMSVLKLLSALFVALLFSGCSSDILIPDAQEVVQADQSEWNEDLSIDDINAMNDGVADIILTPMTGVPREIKGKFSTQNILSAEDAVLAVSSVRGIFGINDLSFACTKIDEEHKTLRVFTLMQLYNGLAVNGGGFTVYATKNGEASAIRGNYVPDLNLDTNPTFDIKELIGELNIEKGTKVISAELVVNAISGEVAPFLAWKFHVKGNSPLTEKYVYIDANSGEVSGEFPTARS
jgi:hypothetical protein